MRTYSNNQLERYPLYLKYFKELAAQGVEVISSPKISAKFGYSEEQVRKDLQNISYVSGCPKRGRQVAQLINDLETFLGYRNNTKTILVGVGHIGCALINSNTLSGIGVEVVGCFDNNPDVIGTMVNGIPVHAMDELGEVIKNKAAVIAILCVPMTAAQDVANKLVEAGILGIWNFAPGVIKVPDKVALENVNLSSSLSVLNHKVNYHEK
ncbi:MAG: redox-sensing transcriptional repressor Rex [Bacilli bacterium]|nr:redox-sensing transcriptional repressor Rex [Bacilli bacterium]